MEFPSLGTHCAFPPCSKLDFLPFTCDCCHQIFCQEHRVYEDHNCTESYVKDVRIPVCPLCNQPIPVKNGEDPNINVNNHITRDCKEQKNKLYSNKCSFHGCKKKELVQMTCSSCHRNYCIKHRLESDHDCDRYHRVAPSTSKSEVKSSSSQSSNRPTSSAGGRASSGGRKPQSSLMSQIGADLNRQRQARHTGNPPSSRTSATTTATTSSTRQNDLTDDEALAIAMAESLQDNPSHNQDSRTQPHPPPSTTSPNQQQNVDDDEALARAIAASLNDQPQKLSTGGQQVRKTKPKSNDDQCVIS